MTTITEAPATTRYFAGIDPSLTGTGICVLDNSGKVTLKTIRTTPKSHGNVFQRIDHITLEIMEVLSSTAKPFICVERPFVNPKNMNAQQDLIALGYVLRERLWRYEYAYWNVTPSALKKFVCDKGTAEKSMMLMKVYQRWDISANNDNEADAAGLARIARTIWEIKNNLELSTTTQNQVDVARKVMTGD